LSERAQQFMASEQSERDSFKRNIYVLYMYSTYVCPQFNHTLIARGPLKLRKIDRV